MEFILYPMPEYGRKRPTSQEILKNRRIELGLTQQQVAEGAGIQLQQYQRIESGERNIESASMKIGLSICAVLKIDPFIFFPESPIRNKYSHTARRKDDVIVKEDAIPLLLEHACSLCNEHLHTNYSLENIKYVCCTMKNIVDVHDSFTSQYKFHSVSPANDDDTYLAEAFVGQTDIDDPNHVDGILIRTDPPEDLDDPETYLTILVHELAHIYCTTHEIESAGKAGQRFYDRYCEGTTDEKLARCTITVGYSIWREFIAEVVQDIVYQQPSKHLKTIAPLLRMLAEKVRIDNPNAKSIFHRYLSEIINTWEGSEAETWEDLEPKLVELDLPFIRIVEHVFKNLHAGDSCITITPEFIEDLGSMYSADMVKNTPEHELARFAIRFGHTAFMN